MHQHPFQGSATETGKSSDTDEPIYLGPCKRTLFYCGVLNQWRACVVMGLMQNNGPSWSGIKEDFPE
jgi:hypothetical protein